MRSLLLKTFLFASVLHFSNGLSAQNALDFDGVDDYVQTTFPAITGNSARTVEAWINTTANAIPNAGGIQQVITDWGSNYQGGRFTFNVLWSNAIRLEVNGNGVSGTIPVNDGQWHHVAAVYDPSAPSPVSLYVDGVLDVAGSLSVTVNTGSDFDLRIGKRIEGLPMFDGSIDEVRVWNTARLQSELAANMTKEFCAIPSELVAYYQFNQGNAGNPNFGETTLNDNSGGGNDGTLLNMTLSGAESNWVTGATMAPGTIDNSAHDDGAGNLTAQQDGVSYQWLDCNNGNAVIAGATGQMYSPGVNGSFAVELTGAGCIDTSACIMISTVGIDQENDLTAMSVYPNPSVGIIQLEMPTDAPTNYQVIDLSGKMVASGMIRSKIATLDLGLAAGTYFLQVTNENGTGVRKMVIR